MNTLTKVAAAFVSLCLMFVPAAVRADFAPGTRVPTGTSAGQTLVWNTSGWTIAPVVYNGNNLTVPVPYTLGVGGPSPGAAVYVAPSSTTQDALSIALPAGATGQAIYVKNSAGKKIFSVGSDGTMTFPGGAPDGDIGFRFNAPGLTPTFNSGALGLGITSQFVTTLLVTSYLTGGFQISGDNNVQLFYMDGGGNLTVKTSMTSPTINATTKFQAGGTDGYTGNIPSTAQSTHVKFGIIVGFTAADGSTVGL